MAVAVGKGADDCTMRMKALYEEIKRNEKILKIVYPSGNSAIHIIVTPSSQAHDDPSNSVPLDVAAAVLEAETAFSMSFTEFLFSKLIDHEESFGLNILASAHPQFLAPTKNGEQRASVVQFYHAVVANVLWAVKQRGEDQQRDNLPDKLTQIWLAISTKPFKSHLNATQTHVPRSPGERILGIRNFNSRVTLYLKNKFIVKGMLDDSETEWMSQMCKLYRPLQTIYDIKHAEYEKIQTLMDFASKGVNPYLLARENNFNTIEELVTHLQTIDSNLATEFLTKCVAYQAQPLVQTPVARPKAEPRFTIANTAFHMIIGATMVKGEAGAHSSGKFRTWKPPSAMNAEGLSDLQDLLRLRHDRTWKPAGFAPTEDRQKKLQGKYDAYETTEQETLMRCNIKQEEWTALVECLDANRRTMVEDVLVNGSQVPGAKECEQNFGAFFSHTVANVSYRGDTATTCDVAMNLSNQLWNNRGLEPELRAATSVIQSVHRVLSAASSRGMDFLSLVDFRCQASRDIVLEMFKKEMKNHCFFLKPDFEEAFWNDILYVTTLALKTQFESQEAFRTALGIADDVDSLVITKGVKVVTKELKFTKISDDIEIEETPGPDSVSVEALEVDTDQLFVQDGTSADPAQVQAEWVSIPPAVEHDSILGRFMRYIYVFVRKHEIEIQDRKKFDDSVRDVLIVQTHAVISEQAHFPHPHQSSTPVKVIQTIQGILNNTQPSGRTLSQGGFVFSGPGNDWTHFTVAFVHSIARLTLDAYGLETDLTETNLNPQKFSALDPAQAVQDYSHLFEWPKESKAVAKRKRQAAKPVGQPANKKTAKSAAGPNERTSANNSRKRKRQDDSDEEEEMDSESSSESSDDVEDDDQDDDEYDPNDASDQRSATPPTPRDPHEEQGQSAGAGQPGAGQPGAGQAGAGQPDGGQPDGGQSAGQAAREQEFFSESAAERAKTRRAAIDAARAAAAARRS